MPIQELETLKQKYPQYANIDDMTLATKLAQKYPAYSSLPGKVAMQSNKSNPDMQGGANAPALVKARKDVSQKTSENQGLDTQSGIVQAAKNYSWPISMMMQKGLGQKDSPDLQPTGSGNKMLSDIGMMANPATGEALKVIGKGIGIGNKAIGNVIKYAKSDNRIGLAEEARNAVFKAKDDLMNTFGGEYERIIGNSDKSIKLQEPVNNFMEESKGLLNNQYFIQDLKFGNPQATKILNLIQEFGKEDFPKEMLAKDANELSKYIKSMPGIKTELAKSPIMRNMTNDQRILMNLSNDLKEQVINEHPDLQDLNKYYGQNINDIKSIRSNLKPNQTIDNLRKYNSWDDELKKSFERQVPKDTVDKIKGFDKADKTAKLLKSLGLWGVRGAAGAAGFKGIAH